MKLNVGDYVRTKDYQNIRSRIGKIIKQDEKYYYLDIDENTQMVWEEDTVLKSAEGTPRGLLDLIEVGDIVINKLGEIIRITSGNIDELKDYWKICENPIKSILTKEQFEEMQYIVKED